MNREESSRLGLALLQQLEPLLELAALLLCPAAHTLGQEVADGPRHRRPLRQPGDRWGRQLTCFGQISCHITVCTYRLPVFAPFQLVFVLMDNINIITLMII